MVSRIYVLRHSSLVPQLILSVGIISPTQQTMPKQAHLIPVPHPILSPLRLQLLNPPLHLLHSPKPQLQFLLLILKPQPLLSIQLRKNLPSMSIKL